MVVYWCPLPAQQPHLTYSTLPSHLAPSASQSPYLLTQKTLLLILTTPGSMVGPCFSPFFGWWASASMHVWGGLGNYHLLIHERGYYRCWSNQADQSYKKSQLELAWPQLLATLLFARFFGLFSLLFVVVLVARCLVNSPAILFIPLPSCSFSHHLVHSPTVLLIPLPSHRFASCLVDLLPILLNHWWPPSNDTEPPTSFWKGEGWLWQHPCLWGSCNDIGRRRENEWISTMMGLMFNSNSAHPYR